MCRFQIRLTFATIRLDVDDSVEQKFFFFVGSSGDVYKIYTKQISEAQVLIFRPNVIEIAYVDCKYYQKIMFKLKI